MGEETNHQYLGDAVYACEVAGGVMLTVENGIERTNTIYLEPEVVHALLGYIHAIQQQGRLE